MRTASKITSHPALTRSRAPGKIILAGEQFVVLGAPAVAMAINLYSYAEAKSNGAGLVNVGIDIPLHNVSNSRESSRGLRAQGFLRPLRLAAEATLDHISRTGQGVDVNSECEIPIAAGLGSSASTTVSIISAVSTCEGAALERKEIFDLAFTPERFLHGNPSGVDQATCIYGGIIEFTRPSNIRQLRIKTDPILLLCDSGIHHETKALVGSVVKKSKILRKDFRDYLTQVRAVSRGVAKSLRTSDDDDLGQLMTVNHELLQKIGVSHPKLDHLVGVANQAGALGAKLTGAGGGGCIIAVCSSLASRERVARKLQRAGGTPIKISRDENGVMARGD